jgi:FKBP-type peptidyl-prolyl cis-trans isomerase
MMSYRWAALAVAVGLGIGCGGPTKHKGEQAEEFTQGREARQPAPAQGAEGTEIRQVKEERPAPPAAPPYSANSGLKCEDVILGTGPAAKKGDLVYVHYTGWLAATLDAFDSSVGKEPFKFTLGAGQVIKGWDEGVVGMKAGGKRKLTIPAKLAYGEKGAGFGRIPPNADLLFEVELLRVVD